MTSAEAKSAINKKFMNYRRTRLPKLEDSDEKSDNSEAKESVAGLLDLRNFTSGKDAFVNSNQDKVLELRDQIATTTGVKPIAAYQQAAKQLWNQVDDREYWETNALRNEKEIFKYVLYIYIL